MRKNLPRKIVIVKNRGMGDSIMGLGTVSYIRSLFPDAKIAYIVPGWLTPLYKNVKIDADEIWGASFNSLRELGSLWWKLCQFKPDIIYEMAQGQSTKRFFSIWSFIYKCAYYFHNHHHTEGPVHDQGNVHKPAIQRDIDGAWSFLARSYNLPLPKYLDFTPEMSLDSREKKEKLIIFGVVATRKTKIWDLKKYVSLAIEIRKNYPEYRISIPLSQGKMDTWIEKELSSLKLPDGVFISKIALSELPAHFSKAALYVGNDTGLKHLAVAMKIKTYTFFGPEPPLEWHPYDKNKHPYFYQDNLECRTAYAHYCALSKCDHMKCLQDFGVGEAFDKIRGDLHNDVHL